MFLWTLQQSLSRLKMLKLLQDEKGAANTNQLLVNISYSSSKGTEYFPFGPVYVRSPPQAEASHSQI